VVVGIDGSRAAMEAAVWAIDEAIDRDVPLRLVHATGMPRPSHGPAAALTPEIEYGETSLRAASSLVAGAGKTVKVEPEILWGSVEDALIAESKSKSDHVDAMILAKLIKAGFLPKSYIPSDETMTWRDMSHHRHCLVKDRTRLKNRVSSSINREGFQISVSDLFGKKGREEIDSLDLSAAARDKINDDLVCIDLLTLQLEKLDQRIMEISESDEVITLLRTIDGIGHILGFTIKAIVGEMFRFKSEKAFANYSGLVPSHRQSGKTTRTGPITKRGPNLLRWALIQAVPHAVRKSDYLKRKYNRIIYKSSCGKAKVAAAHDLAKIVYHVWTEARPYYR